MHASWPFYTIIMKWAGNSIELFESSTVQEAYFFLIKKIYWTLYYAENMRSGLEEIQESEFDHSLTIVNRNLLKVIGTNNMIYLKDDIY